MKEEGDRAGSGGCMFLAEAVFYFIRDGGMQRQVSEIPHVLFGSLLVPYRSQVAISLSTNEPDGLSKVKCLGDSSAFRQSWIQVLTQC